MSDKEKAPAVTPAEESVAPETPAQPTKEQDSDSGAVETTTEANDKATDAKDDVALSENGDDEKVTPAKDVTPAEAIGADDEGAFDGGAASSSKKNQKRRSSTGVPEHKNKKLNRKKSVATLRLDAKPGDYYWARLKGYPPWPAIICDEDILPESLHLSRPVTAMRPDGKYREDYQDDGKNVRDRTYPVMYLGTNEFSWTPNTDLTPLDIEEVKNVDKAKKTKALVSAYEVASEGHDLEYFKELIRDYEKILQEDKENQEKVAQEKQDKKDKKAKRQSKGKDTVEDAEDDVEMEDAPEEAPNGDGAQPKKATKKRKKDAESEGEAPKPAKTPKTKKAAAPKTPNGDSAAKPKSKKATKAAKGENAEETPAAKQLTEEEKKAKREKEVLFLRHKLQKGFLSRDQAPKEEEMKVMAEHFKALEGFKDLEADIIRSTKIHKVLKAIIKLATIPKDEEYRFKERSIEILDVWQKAIAASEGSAVAGEEAATNGAKEEKSDTEKAAEEEATERVKEPVAEGASNAELGDDAKDEADEAMTDAKAEIAEEDKKDTDAIAAEEEAIDDKEDAATES